MQRATTLHSLLLALLFLLNISEAQSAILASNGTDFMATVLGASALPLTLAVSRANVSDANNDYIKAVYWDTGLLSIVGQVTEDQQRPLLDLGSLADVTVSNKNL